MNFLTVPQCKLAWYCSKSGWLDGRDFPAYNVLACPKTAVAPTSVLPTRTGSVRYGSLVSRHFKTVLWQFMCPLLHLSNSCLLAALKSGGTNVNVLCCQALLQFICQAARPGPNNFISSRSFLAFYGVLVCEVLAAGKVTPPLSQASLSCCTPIHCSSHLSALQGGTQHAVMPCSNHMRTWLGWVRLVTFMAMNSVPPALLTHTCFLCR